MTRPNLRLFAHLKDALAHNWRLRARPSQIPPPGDWAGWLILSGRGWGKTWTGSNFVHECASTGQARKIALIGATAADVRDVMTESGILAAAGHDRPNYEPSKRKITWKNGATAHLYSSEEADRLRGPQHDLIWADELAAWNNPQACWDQAMFGLRVGHRPRWIATTTPRPLKILKALVAREERDVVVVRGSTYENQDNLAPGFLQELKNRYEGTRLARQEINAEILEDVAGALWTREMLDKARYDGAIPDLRRVVVAIDPSGTSGNDSGDSVGIVVAGVGADNLCYVLADRTCKLSPDGWGRVAVNAYREFKADRIIAEKNFGGAMVQHVIRTVDSSVSYRDVHASRGKIARAEPVAALYESGKVRHCGAFTDLEDQLCGFTGAGYLGDGSPDRADALAWCVSELMLNAATPLAAFSTYSAFATPTQNSRSKFDGALGEETGLAGGFATSR